MQGPAAEWVDAAAVACPEWLKLAGGAGGGLELWCWTGGAQARCLASAGLAFGANLPWAQSFGVES